MYKRDFFFSFLSNFQNGDFDGFTHLDYLLINEALFKSVSCLI